MKKLWKNKKGLLLSLGCVTLAALTGGIFLIARGCDKNEEPVNYENDGSYYFSAVDGDYSLSMSVGHCTLTIGNVTKFGTYDWEGDVMQFVFEDGTTATGTATNGSMSLVYNNATLVFLKKTEYTVSYSVENAVASTVKVLNGKTVSKPADPAKEGYYFVGWYTDTEYKNPFMFDATPILANTTLYARFVEAKVGQNEFNVTYVVDGEEYKTATTKSGVVYDLPTPVKENATFAGWWVSDYQDGAKLTYQYTDQVLTESTNLYAVWASADPQVSVDENGVKWNAVDAGTNYTVTIYNANGTQLATQKTTALEFAFDFASRSAGDYTVEVKTDEATTTAYYKNKTLDRVSNFTVAEPSVLVFNAVDNAQKYVITVDCGNDAHEHTSYDNGTYTSFNFANCAMQEGGITFVVEAIANGYVSSVSEKYVYTRELDALTGLTFDSEAGILYWNTVEKASAYKVEITTANGTDTYTVNGKTFSLKNYTGDVSVKVSAVAKGYNASSATIAYNSEKLVAPTGVKLNYNTVEWNAVDGAVKYNVKIGSKVYDTTATSLDLPADFQSSGMNYDVSVQAVGAAEAQNSYYSDAISVKYGLFENVTYINGALRWDSVGGAAIYLLSVNGEEATELPQGANSAEVEFTKSGENTIVLTAKNFLGRTLDTREVTVTANAIILDSRTTSGQTTQYKAVGDTINFPELTYAGYDFAGWYNVPGGAGNNGAEFEDTTYQGNGTTILYAYWTPKAYEVKLFVGETEFATETVYYKEHYTLSTVDSPDQAKTFGGWFAESNSQGRQYTNPLGESLNVWDLTNGATLYAGWIDVLNYEMITAGDGSKAYQVSKGAGIDYVKEVTIPETYTDPVTQETLPVIAIAASAFYQCDYLETINIPDTIQSIYIGIGGPVATGSAFYSCDRLTAINIYCVDGSHDSTEEDARHDHETYFSSVDGVLLRHNTPQAPLEDGTEIYFFPKAKTGSYTIPDYITNIPRRTFYQSQLSEIIIPASVKKIGSYAFNSSSLETVVFEKAADGVEEVPLTLGDRAFASCSSLVSIAFPARLQETDFRALNMFLYDYKLVEFTINGEYEQQFYTSNNGMLCDVYGKTILYCAPYKTGEVTIPVAIEEIGASAFKDCARITKLVIGDNVRVIGANAFQGCTQLIEIDFRGETGALSIGASAFYGCKNLRDLTLPANLKVLGPNAFGDTQSVRKVTLNCGEGLDLAVGAFADVDGYGYVTNVVIGEKMEAFEVNGVFSGCRINTVSIQGNNKNYYADEKGVLYNSDQTKLIFYPHGQTDTTYVIPDTVVAIGAGVFESKSNLTEMTIGKNVKSIGDNAFKDMVLLERIIFEAGRTEELTIGAGAFQGCIKLTEVDIPETVVSIGSKAFMDCAQLKEITLPVSLERIGEVGATSVDIFNGCDLLEKITIVGDSDYFATENGLFYGKTEGIVTSLYFVPSNVTGAIVIPGTVTVIPEKAFYQHKGITEITFTEVENPTGVTIGKYAFAETVALEKVILPAGATEVPDYAFYKSSVKEVFVPNTVGRLGIMAFYNATKLDTLTFESGNEELELQLDGSKLNGSSSAKNYGTFYGIKVTELKLPERVKKIPDFYFGNSTFNKIVIPASVETIGSWAFNATTATEIVFAKRADGTRSLKTVGYYTFYNADKLTSVEVPKGIVYSGSYSSGNQHGMFNGCDALTTVTFEEGITEIGSYMFATCKKLTSITIPDSVKVIGAQAFLNCTGLTSVTLPAELAEISENLFKGCSGLTSISIPATVRVIGDNAFQNCTKLETINFASLSDNALISNIETVGAGAFEATKITSFVLPENVSNKNITLGAAIFKDCESLATAVIPASVLNLNSAFMGCSALTSLTYNAVGSTVDDVNKIIYSNDGKRVVFYYGTSEELVLPNTVEEIGNGAFAGKTNLKKMTLPASLKVIDNNAFQDCTSLTMVEGLAETGLVRLGEYAFAGSAITSVTLPDTLVALADDAPIPAIGHHAFEGCKSLTSATVNGTAMGSYMFKDCTALTTVTLNDNIKALNGWTFYGCSKLNGVTLPSKLTKVNMAEFYGCTSLTAIELPDTLTISYRGGGSSLSSSDTPEKVEKNGYYGANMFYGCTKLASVKLGSSIGNIAGAMFYNCSSLTSLEIPDGVVGIGNYAFYGCSKLAELTFPDSLEIVYYYSVFRKCSSLTKLDFSNTKLGTNTSSSWASQIGPYCFAECTKLKEIIFPETLTTIYSDAFSSFTALEKLVAPGVMEVKFKFSNATKLHTVELSDNLISIVANAFKGCSSLTSFNFPDTLTSIGTSAFEGTKLAEIKLGANLTTIGANAFKGTPITQVEIPAMVSSIGNGAFAECPNLVAYSVDPANAYYQAGNYGELYDALNALVAFPAGATGDDGYVKLEDGVALGSYAFQGCLGVTAVELPSTLVEIPEGLFYGCNIIRALIPAGVRTIGEYAFYNCDDLVAVDMPNTVTEIKAYAFEGCTNLKDIKLSSSLKELGARSFRYSGIVSVTIPRTVEKVGGEYSASAIDEISQVFMDCKSLETVVFEDAPEVILGTTFSGCTALKNVTLNGSWAEIPDSTFKGCTSLESIIIPDTVTAIGAYAFSQTGIKSITIPANAKVLGTEEEMVLMGADATVNSIFLNCTALETVVFMGAPDIMYESMFEGCISLKNVTLNGNWTTIPAKTFKGCTALESITLPETLTKIEKQVFLSSGLKSVVIPNSVTEIQAGAFEDCKSLEAVTLSNTLETIGAFAFSKTAITSITIPASVTTLGSADASGLSSGSSSGGGIGGLKPGLIIKPGIGGGTSAATETSSVFLDCKSLTTVVFEGAPTTMHGSTFKGCTALTSVTLNGNWTKLEKNMFEGCTSLTNFTIPASVTSIGADAFKGWTAAQVINVPDKTAAEATAAWGRGWNGNATVNYKTEA